MDRDVITEYITMGDGCRIAYKLEGKKDAPVILLANSIATTMDMWEGNMKDLTREYQVLRYDFRGHGSSDVPDGPYSIDRFGYDVIEMLDTLKIEHVHFIGLSLGGFVAQWLALHAPERIDKLVLANTSAYLGPRKQWDTAITKAQSTSDMTEFADMFIHNWFSKQMIKVQTQLITPFKHDILAMSPRGLASSFAITRDFDLRKMIKLIDRPTLIIAGEHDSVTTPQMSDEIAHAISSARLEILPVSHLSNVECPEEFTSLVLNFLDNI
jgi:3-oxoadipate enol-lactonase